MHMIFQANDTRDDTIMFMQQNNAVQWCQK